MQPENNTSIQPPVNQVQPDPAPAPAPTPPQANEQTTSIQPPVKRSQKKLILIIAAIVAIFVALVVVGVILVFTSTSKSVKAANDFTAAFTKKDLDNAYNFFSPELKQEQTLEQFKTAFGNAPFNDSCILKIQNREASTSTSTGSSTNISGSITCGKTSYPTEYTFITSNGSEKLLSYRIKPAAN